MTSPISASSELGQSIIMACLLDGFGHQFSWEDANSNRAKVISKDESDSLYAKGHAWDIKPEQYLYDSDFNLSSYVWIESMLYPIVKDGGCSQIKITESEFIPVGWYQEFHGRTIIEIRRGLVAEPRRLRPT